MQVSILILGHGHSITSGLNSHEILPSSACLNTSPKQGNGFFPLFFFFQKSHFSVLKPNVVYVILQHGAGVMPWNAKYLLRMWNFGILSSFFLTLSG